MVPMKNNLCNIQWLFIIHNLAQKISTLVFSKLHHYMLYIRETITKCISNCLIAAIIRLDANSER